MREWKIYSSFQETKSCEICELGDWWLQLKWSKPLVFSNIINVTLNAYIAKSVSSHPHTLFENFDFYLTDNVLTIKQYVYLIFV